MKNSSDNLSKSIHDRLESIKKDFSRFSHWEEKYQFIIEKGRELKALPEAEKKDDLKVKGCQSQVWLKADFLNGRVHFQADSDALIVKGLVALLLEIFDQATPDQILNTPTDFVRDLGLDQALSPSRSNGLYSMIKQIYYYGLAFKTLQQSR